MSELLPTERMELDAGIDGVVLKQLVPADAQRYLDLIAYDREHFRRTGETTADKYQTIEDVLESFEKQPEGRKRFGIWADGVMVGSINYQPTYANAVELGYWVGKEYAGQGYAAKAVKTLVPHIFGEGWSWAQAWARADNAASRKTLRSAGFYDAGKDIMHDNHIWYTMRNPKLAQ